ncbi:MAG: helix-turn-helix transcriptional regulator [Pseudomonadota bacterium]
MSQREGEVLKWIALDKSNNDIVGILKLGPRTVTKHLDEIYRRLGVKKMDVGGHGDASHSAVIGRRHAVASKRPPRIDLKRETARAYIPAARPSFR